VRTSTGAGPAQNPPNAQAIHESSKRDLARGAHSVGAARQGRRLRPGGSIGGGHRAFVEGHSAFSSPSGAASHSEGQFGPTCRVEATGEAGVAGKAARGWPPITAEAWAGDFAAGGGARPVTRIRGKGRACKRTREKFSEPSSTNRLPNDKRGIAPQAAPAREKNHGGITTPPPPMAAGTPRAFPAQR